MTEVEDGRYIWGGGYSAEDAVTSPLIDAGDPASVFTNEPNYNGGRINMRMWGNTASGKQAGTGEFGVAGGKPVRRGRSERERGVSLGGVWR